MNRKRDDDLDDEIQSHIQMSIRDRVERGESESDARAAALRELGNVGLIKETTRSVWTWTSLEQLLQDVRFGVRWVSVSNGNNAGTKPSRLVCFDSKNHVANRRRRMRKPMLHIVFVRAITGQFSCDKAES